MTDASSYRPDPEQIYQSYLSRLPDDAKARLAEPRDEDLQQATGLGAPTCRLKARDPATTLSPFLRVLVTYFSDDGAQLDKLAKIDNVERTFAWSGRGHGFHPDDIKGRPRLRMAFGSRDGLPALWSLGRFFVASPAMHSLLRKYEPEALATVDIDVEFEDGVSKQGYVFLDFIAKRFAWDYTRSEVDVYLNEGRRYLRLESQRTLRGDIPATAHLFRDISNDDDLHQS